MKPARLVALAFWLLAGAAAAEEPSGCDKFAFDISADRTALLATTPATAGDLDRGAGRFTLEVSGAPAKDISVLVRRLD